MHDSEVKAEVFSAGVLLVGAAVLALAAVVGFCSATNADVLPWIDTSAEAVPLAACQTAQIQLHVTGAGDPVIERLPLEGMLVLDRSGSINAATLAAIKADSDELIDQLDASIDRTGMTSFSTSATLNAGLTTDFASVKTAIAGLVASGNTNIGAGVLKAQQEFATNGFPLPAVRVMVLLTDGIANLTASGTSCTTTPTTSNACTQDAVNQAAAAKAAGTVVFTIGLNLSAISPIAARNLARSTLQTMASSPDKYFEAPTSGSLQGVFTSIANIVTTIAGADVVLTDILPPAVHYLSGSAIPAPTTVDGQTLTWNLGLVGIGQAVDVTFEVGLSPFVSNQLVDVFPDSRVDYSDYQGTPASAAFPETYVSAVSCSTCGDGVLDPGEDCDDANTISGDCCAEDCTLEASGSPCDDGLSCTLDDQCSGFGICRGTPSGGRTSAGVYGILGWSTTNPPGTAVTALSGRVLIKGDVCSDSIRVRNYSRIIGDAVGLLPAGTPIKFFKRTSVAGGVITAGGTISGLAKVRVLTGHIDTDGAAPELDACASAREQATAKQMELSALTPSPGLDLAAVTVKAKRTQTIPATGDLGPGDVVIRINGDVKLGSYAKLTIKGAPTTNRVIVRILGKLLLRNRAKIELDGLTPAQVIYVVDGLVKARSYTKIGGTIFGADSVTLGARSRTNGAVLGGALMKSGSYAIVNRQPWVGWCD